MATRRVTQAMIAARAGVTTMTVSNVLRGKRGVSEATRRKVMKLAKSMGYVSDPHIAKLMEHLRTGRSLRVQANLAFLASAETDYALRLFESAREKAAEFGYHLEWLPVSIYQGNPKRLRSVLLSRGVEGLLLGPLAVSGKVRHLDDWTGFSVVSLSYSITSPRFDTVVPNQFHNTMEALRQVRAAGFKCPALVTKTAFDERVNHAFTAAFAWDAYYNGQREVRIFSRNSPQPEALSRWLAEVQPDCILSSEYSDIRGILESPKRIEAGGTAIVRLAFEEGEPHRFPGIDQNVGLVGARGSEILVRNIQQRKTGVPTSAVVTMVEGTWEAGEGLSIN